MRVRARVHFLTTAEGGLSTPIRGGWFRPNHNFGALDQAVYDIGQVTFPDTRHVFPGDSVDAVIEFLDRPGLDLLLVPGRAWSVHEGSRLVGKAEVVALI